MRTAIYLLFFLSGFVGLIYEAVFSRYLKLFLGHSSYGQLLTIVVFMGGLGLGAFIAGRFASKVKEAFKTYAFIEFAVAIWGLLFHPLYTGVTTWFYNHVDWFAGIPGGIWFTKIALSVAMTVPCAMLLGMTFPLLAVGVMRLTGDGGKKTLSLLYFTNSFGAALGILVTSYYFIRDFGTPGSLLIASCGNVLVGLGFLAITRHLWSHPFPREKKSSQDLESGTGSLESANVKLWLGLAFGTGFASFIYEIGWIRLLSLLMGSSSHSFDIMISAFVLGLAFGGLYAKRLLERCRNLPSLLVGVQVLMGMFALCSIYFYRPFFDAVHGSHSVLANTENAYAYYGIFKYLLALGLMFPASFCAGITLPVITYYLCSRNGGERYTGYVYGFNTIGSICGAVMGGLVLLPFLQLKWTLAFGATLDMALGLMILFYFPVGTMRYRRILASAAGVALVPLLFVQFENCVVAGGAFRVKDKSFGKNPESFLAVRDGRTATISLRKTGIHLSLATNGKTDGAIVEKSMRGLGTPGDDATVAQLAFLPALTRTQPYNCAIVGMGTGMTLHHLLGDDLLEEVDMIEIEKAVLELSEKMRPTNERAFTDNRVNFVVEDAKSYFYQSGKKYDVIISEPSNPWISGVSSLFTREYYSQLRKFLKPGGVLVQWGHKYEFRDDLAFSIMAALSEFPYFEIYNIEHSGDFMMIAGERPFEFAGFDRWDKCEGIRSDFQEMKWNYERLGPGNFLASSTTLQSVIRNWKPSANSDYYPYVDQFAEQSFFTKETTRFQLFLEPQFGSYQELYEPERLRKLKSYTSRKTPGYADLVNGKMLRTLLRGLDKEGDWDIAEKTLLAETARYFYSGSWHEIEPVVDYGKLVEGGQAPEAQAIRYRYLKSVATNDLPGTTKVITDAVLSFTSEGRNPRDAWLRSFIVNSIKVGNLGLTQKLIEEFVDRDENFPPDEKEIVRDLVEKATLHFAAKK